MYFDPKFGKMPEVKAGDKVFTRRHSISAAERFEVLSVEKDARAVTWVRVKSCATGKKALCLLQEIVPSNMVDAVKRGASVL